MSSILLKDLSHQLQMHTVILQVGLGIIHVFQTLAPIDLEAAPFQEMPDRSDSHTRQPFRRICRDGGIPGPAVIEKWHQVQKFFPDRRCVQRNTSLEGTQKHVVSKQRELPIASDRKSR